MVFLKNNPVKNFVVDEMINKLNDYRGQEVYASDLAFKLFECENMTGSYWCNAFKSQEWLKNNFDYLGEIIEEIKNNFDNELIKDLFIDFFDNPEKVQLIIILEVANYITNVLPTICDNWENEIELTPQIINQLTKELEALKD